MKADAEGSSAGHPNRSWNAGPTHAMWHVVAPAAEDFTVVVADLPGYGKSAPTASRSKREMAATLVATMNELGFDRFAVAGHDRGGRCAAELSRAVNCLGPFGYYGYEYTRSSPGDACHA